MTEEPDEFEFLIDLARSLNEKAEPAAAKIPRGAKTDQAANRPGDDFNARASWAEILEPHGWRAVWESGGKIYWKRPDKTDRGWSATTGYCHSEMGGDLLYVFSSNAGAFESERCYSKFGAYCVLNHHGDFAAASKKLAEEGYGEQEILFRRARSPEKPSADTSDDPLDADATAADLIAANVTVRWLWMGWIPVGVLTILASEPGIGKTRLCADLHRRITLGLPWPDGSAMTLPRGAKCLWLPADNQHAELGTLPRDFGFDPDSLYLNATKRNPFCGTMLDEKEDLRDFEARINRVKPAMVFVDTTTNATDRTAHKPEDAKAFFKPLQEIAARTQTAIVCVTHLNAAGKPLGRRIEGQGRVVLMLAKPDESQENRRRFWVRKSNSLKPAPLGVTMSSDGNEYDLNPPEMASGEPGTGPKASRLEADCDWLRTYLSTGSKRVGYTRTAAEEAGIPSSRLYRAKDAIGVEEFEAENRKWWRLPSKEESQH